VPDKTVSKGDVNFTRLALLGSTKRGPGIDILTCGYLSGAGKPGVGRSEISGSSSASPLQNLPIFSGPLTHTRGLQGKIMAEIHDQFDTILILDFGSQVRSQLTRTETS
jgi:hypothetical protein